MNGCQIGWENSIFIGARTHILNPEKETRVDASFSRLVDGGVREAKYVTWLYIYTFNTRLLTHLTQKISLSQMQVHIFIKVYSPLSRNFSSTYTCIVVGTQPSMRHTVRLSLSRTFSIQKVDHL